MSTDGYVPEGASATVIEEVLADLGWAVHERCAEYDYSLDGDRIVLRPLVRSSDLLPPIGYITYTPFKETP